MGKWVLGIDAGFANIGWSLFDKYMVLKEAGFIHTEKQKHKKGLRVVDDDCERIKESTRQLKKVIDRFFIDDKVLFAIEMPSGGAQGARANRAMGIATGQIISIATLYDFPIEIVLPHEVKMVATGRKNGSKEEIMDYVRKKYDIGHLKMNKSKFEHIADSICAAEFVSEHSELFKVL